MEEARGDLLADAALTRDQDPGVGMCRAFDVENDLAHGRADADECRPFPLGHTSAPLATTVPLYGCAGSTSQRRRRSDPLSIVCRRRQTVGIRMTTLPPRLTNACPCTHEIRRGGVVWMLER